MTSTQIALLFCEKYSSAVRGFVNMEGNLAPEDCMFSRKVVEHDFETFASTVFPKIKNDLASKEGAGFAAHLATLNRFSSPRAYFDYTFQTVEYSDEGNLLERFLALNMPTLFVYGSENEHLSYLPVLRESKCTLARIASANHFSFHDDPEAFSQAMASFVNSIPNR